MPQPIPYSYSKCVLFHRILRLKNVYLASRAQSLILPGRPAMYVREEARRNVMPTLLLHTKTTLLALAVAAILAGPGHTDPLDPRIQSAATQNAAVLGALIRNQDARRFQQQQQNLREQDRHVNQ